MQRRVFIAAVAALSMTVAPAAFAKGGGGGGTTTAPTATAPAGGGGGGGGGGTGGGGGGGGGGGRNSGVNDVPAAPAPPPPPQATVPCATLTSGSATVGYYSVYAALWNNFSMRSCGDGQETVTLEVINRDVADGSVDYDVVVPYTLGSGQTTGGVYDNDFAPFSTTYDVTYRITDASGKQLDSQTYSATTPAPQ